MKAIKIFSFLFVLTFFASNAIIAQSWYGSGIKGEGPVVKKTLNLDQFDAVKLSFSGHVYLKQGSTQSVEIEGQQNIIDNIVTEVHEKAWKIKFDKNVKKHEEVKIWITIPHLTAAAVSGSGDMESENHFKGLGDLNVAVSGSGNIDLECDAKSINVAVSGSGDVELEGQTGNIDVRISGSGDVEAGDLSSETCSVRIAGSGDASVNVQENLDVRIAGSGDVYYSGSPRVKSKISGSGDVTAK